LAARAGRRADRPQWRASPLSLHAMNVSVEFRSIASRLAPLAAALLLAACAAVPQGPGPLTGGQPPAPGQPTTPAQAPSLGLFSKIKVTDDQQPVLRFAARGVQVFRCERRDGDVGWWYRLPEADLVDVKGAVVARHGADFSFEHVDGSRLLGKVLASDAAPRDADLRWLLLSTRSFGQGAFTGITYVQRVNTSGGMPPAKCDPKQLNQLLRVDFTAEFVFYRPR
jgi:hypothetical protein